MASFASAATITQLLSPSEASKLSGRYESVVKKKNGDEVKVLRSLRHAPNQDLLVRANITPQKVKLTSKDVDDLCDLFKTSVSVSPKKTPTNHSAKKDKSVADEKTPKKTNVVSSPVNKRRGTASATKKAILFKDDE